MLKDKIIYLVVFILLLAVFILFSPPSAIRGQDLQLNNNFTYRDFKKISQTADNLIKIIQDKIFSLELEIITIEHFRKNQEFKKYQDVQSRLIEIQFELEGIKNVTMRGIDNLLAKIKQCVNVMWAKNREEELTGYQQDMFSLMREFRNRMDRVFNSYEQLTSQMIKDLDSIQDEEVKKTAVNELTEIHKKMEKSIQELADVRRDIILEVLSFLPEKERPYFIAPQDYFNYESPVDYIGQHPFISSNNKTFTHNFIAVMGASPNAGREVVDAGILGLRQKWITNPYIHFIRCYSGTNICVNVSDQVKGFDQNQLKYLTDSREEDLKKLAFYYFKTRYQNFAIVDNYKKFVITIPKWEETTGRYDYIQYKLVPGLQTKWEDSTDSSVYFIFQPKKSDFSLLAEWRNLYRIIRELKYIKQIRN